MKIYDKDENILLEILLNKESKLDLNLLEINEEKEEVKGHSIKIREAGRFISIKFINEHIMIDTHYIKFIIIETNLGMYIRYFKIGDKLEFDFVLAINEKINNIYSYCNVHGLFKQIF